MQPWDRVDQESTPAYAAFQAYLNLGDKRSLSKTAADVGKNITLMKRWSTRYTWGDRARAYDAWIVQNSHEGRAEGVRSASATDGIEEYRRALEKSLGQLDLLASGALSKLAVRISTLNPQDIDPKSIPGWMRGIAALKEAVANERATVLGIDQLMEAWIGKEGPAESPRED